MKVVPLEGMALTVPELVAMAQDGPVILTRDGRPFLSVREVSGSDWESTALAHNPTFSALIEGSRDAYRNQGGIGMAGLRQELGLDASSSDA